MVPLGFRLADILLVGFFRRLTRLFNCPAFVPGRLSLALNWAPRPSIHAFSLGLGMDILYFSFDLRVARWSHSVAELLLVLLAVAGFRMGEL